MREIKFRAWDNEDKAIKYSGISIDISGLRKLPDFDLELMQFTGLKDKNGKEIYEGDIVAKDEAVLYDGEDVRQVNAISVRKVSNYEYWGGSTGTRWFGRPTHTVQWKQDSCGFEPFSDSEENCGHCGVALSAREVEVIGNIYENPELLKV